MKERITYLLHVGEKAFDPSALAVGTDGLVIPSIKAAKEHRLTLRLSELPHNAALLYVLEQSSQLHIRWATPKPYLSTPPYVSRIPPGLHVFFTPRGDQETSGLCPALKTVFGVDLKCNTPSDTFVNVTIHDDRASMSGYAQYYSLLPSLRHLAMHLSGKVCTNDGCRAWASSLPSASYVDLDFDSVSHALVISAFWADGPIHGGVWNENIVPGDSDKMEVGILSNEVPLEPGELSLSGFLTIVGSDARAKPTLFAFPSRHHPLPSTAHPVHPEYYVAFDHPAGLHPTLRLSFSRPKETLTPPRPSCALHTYLTLPSAFFLDKYQLFDPLFLSSQNLRGVRALLGAVDLEAPDWVVTQWGSVALFELAYPEASEAFDATKAAAGDDRDYVVSIPMHLRYLPPAGNTSGITDASLPWPVVFWACPADEGAALGVNPFDRTNLGYERLFGDSIVFYHISPATGRAADDGGMVESIKVPVLDLDRAWYIEYGTVVAVLLATAWLLARLGSMGRHAGRGTGREAAVSEAKKRL